MYRVDETGVINTYANEPATYLAWAPGYQEQMNYLRLGSLAFVFVSSVIATAFFVS